MRGLATASLVLGIIAVVFAPFCGPIGVVLALIGIPLGGVAVARIRSGQVAADGRGMAIAGLVLGIVALVLALLVFLVFFGAAMNLPDLPNGPTI